MSENPIQDVPFGTALKISLDHYYDILRANVGNLGSEEYLQLKLVADAVDISEGRYPWFSYYSLLRRSDQAIDPTPVTGTLAAAATELAADYERFLRKLRGYVVKATLSADDERELAARDLELDRLRRKMLDMSREDRATWREFAEQMGYSVGDTTAYLQWAAMNGHLREIEEAMRRMRDLQFEKKTILDKQYPDPADREVVDAEIDFESPGMRLRYPIHPDFDYPNGEQFNLVYLASLPLGSSALFDDRRVVTWDKTLAWMKSENAGGFDAKLSSSSSESKSIETDWRASARGRYSFVRARASASEHQKITEDFSKATAIDLSAQATYRVEIRYPKWFRPSLFKHPRVRQNIHDFEPFFGPKGSLLYHPRFLVFVRGFKASFTSSQNWSYDYQRRYSASAGGGFSVFGIGFGASGSYTRETKEHKVASGGTTLTFEDDNATVRFVGYVVKRESVYEEEIRDQAMSALEAGSDPWVAARFDEAR